MAGIKIPGSESIDTVAPTRDPGVQASAEQFGAGVGASQERYGGALINDAQAEINLGTGMAHFGDAMGSLSAHLYQNLQKQTSDVWVQTHEINSATAYTNAIYENRAAFPKGDADGGTAAQDDMRQRIAAANSGATAQTTTQLGKPTDTAMARVNAAMADRAVNALTQQATYSNNQQVLGKRSVLDDNVKAIGSRVLSGDMSLDDGMKAIEAQATAGKPLYSAQELVDAKDKWQKDTAVAAVLNKYKAGDKAGGDAIRDQYFGAVPKSAGAVNTDLPGDMGRRIDDAAINAGIDPTVARVIAKMESNGDARATKGSYKGIFQLSDAGFAANGGKGDIYNADENIKAGVASLKRDSDAFTATFGRPPTPTELYLSHQQGQAGLASQLANPGAPAWQNMASTGEGRAKGEAWAKMAIWGNIPDAQKAQFGSVNNVTGQQFVNLWRAKIEGGSAMPTGKSASAAGSGGDGTDEDGDSATGSSQGGPAPVLPDTSIALRLEQQSKAISADQKQAAAKAHADKTAVSQTAELEIFKDMHSANPTMSTEDILNNPRLLPESAIKMAALKMAPKNNGDGYGVGFNDLYQRVHSPPGTDGHIADPQAIYPLAKAGGPLTPAGADKLVADINEKKTFDGASRQSQISEFLKGVKSHITGEDLGIDLKDPEGERRFANYHVAFDTALSAALAKGDKPLGTLLSGDGDLFKMSEQYARPRTEWYSQLIKDNPTVATGGKAIPAKAFDISTITSLADLKVAVKKGTVTNNQANKYAVGMGWARSGPAPVAIPVTNAPVSN